MVLVCILYTAADNVLFCYGDSRQPTEKKWYRLRKARADKGVCLVVGWSRDCCAWAECQRLLLSKYHRQSQFSRSCSVREMLIELEAS
jgi:hypothetical protein